MNKPAMFIDRIIGNKDHLVKVGICSIPPDKLVNTTEYIQCMQVDSAPPTFLKKNKSTYDTLEYQFGNGSTLTFNKCMNSNDIFYTIKTDTVVESNKVADSIRKHYKTIGMPSSIEVDKIAYFIKQ